MVDTQTLIKPTSSWSHQEWESDRNHFAAQVQDFTKKIGHNSSLFEMAGCINEVKSLLYLLGELGFMAMTLQSQN